MVSVYGTSSDISLKPLGFLVHAWLLSALSPKILSMLGWVIPCFLFLFF